MGFAAQAAPGVCRLRGVFQSALVLPAAALLRVCCLQGYPIEVRRLVSCGTSCPNLSSRSLCCLQEFVVETRPTGREAEHTEDRTSEVSCWQLSSQDLRALSLHTVLCAV